MDLLNSSSDPQAFKDMELQSEEKTLGMLMYLLGMFTSFLGPLIIFALKREESHFLDTQGKNYFNFMISYSIYVMVSLVLTTIIIGIIPFLFFAIAFIVYSFIGMFKVNDGEDYLAPFSLKLLK